MSLINLCIFLRFLKKSKKLLEVKGASTVCTPNSFALLITGESGSPAAAALSPASIPLSINLSAYHAVALNHRTLIKWTIFILVVLFS